MTTFRTYLFVFLSSLLISKIHCSVCKDGFKLIPGDVPGRGEFGSNGKFSNISDTDQCGTLCLANLWCKSYEYSATEKCCNLNRKAEPTDPKIYKDYSFCSLKGNEVKNLSPFKKCWRGSNALDDLSECHDGFELISPTFNFVPIPGWGKFPHLGTHSSIKNTTHCGQLCFDTDGCEYYAYSPKDKRCNLKRKFAKKGFKQFYSFCKKSGKSCRNGCSKENCILTVQRKYIYFSIASPTLSNNSEPNFKSHEIQQKETNWHRSLEGKAID